MTRTLRSRAAGLLLPVIVLLAVGRLQAAAVHAQKLPVSGLLVTLSATAEALESEAEREAGGITIRVTLDNQSGGDLAVVRIDAPVPARTRVTGSSGGLGDPSRARSEGEAVVWEGIALSAGQQSDAFAYRVVPMAGADGAVIFRDAGVRPSVGTRALVPVRVVESTLPLNGLWGEGGLRRTVLPSGLTVFTRERPDSATVTLLASIRAGSRDETEATRGGSHWLEHAHFLGTARRPDNQAIFSAITRLGGEINATTGVERTRYFNTVPASEFETALDLLADQLLGSTFPLEAFDRERRVVFEELRTRLDSPNVRATDEFFRLVWQLNPSRQDAAGIIESVQSIPIAAILAYREARYTTGNTAVAAVGNLRHDEAVGKIARAFAPLRVGPRAARPYTPEPVQTEMRRLEFGEGTRSAEIRLGWPVAGETDTDWAALVVLSDILGTTGRRLQEQVRDRGQHVLSISNFYTAYSDTGAIVVVASTQAERVDGAMRAILAEFQRLREGDFDETDLQASIRSIAGRIAVAAESNLAQASDFADSEVSGGLLSTAEALLLLRGVTHADVQRVARTYLNLDAFTVVIGRP